MMYPRIIEIETSSKSRKPMHTICWWFTKQNCLCLLQHRHKSCYQASHFTHWLESGQPYLSVNLTQVEDGSVKSRCHIDKEACVNFGQHDNDTKITSRYCSITPSVCVGNDVFMRDLPFAAIVGRIAQTISLSCNVRIASICGELQVRTEYCKHRIYCYSVLKKELYRLWSTV